MSIVDQIAGRVLPGLVDEKPLETWSDEELDLECQQQAERLKLVRNAARLFGYGALYAGKKYLTK